MVGFGFCNDTSRLYLSHYTLLYIHLNIRISILADHRSYAAPVASLPWDVDGSAEGVVMIVLGSTITLEL